MSHDRSQARDAIRLAAARWVVRLAAEDCDGATRKLFEAWRSANVDHAVAFERELYAWERTERLRSDREVVAEVHAERAGAARRFRFATWPVISRLAARAAAVVVCAGAAVFLWSHASSDEYVTGVGERRTVVLEDGSRLELNTATELAVRMTGGRRTVELLRGETLFQVAPDASRPFVVELGHSRVRAVGTAFNIRRDAGEHHVLVTEGVVEAAGQETSESMAYSIRLAAGMAGDHTARGMLTRAVSAQERERLLAWRTGTIALAGETLQQAVAEFNRYNLTRVVIADPAIAGIELGGVFDANDLAGFIKTLSATFAIEAVATGSEIQLRGRTRSQDADGGPASG